MSAAARKGTRKSRSLRPRLATKVELAVGAALYPERPGVHYTRPAKRAECLTGPRPCPYVSCRHHLYLDVSPRTGTIKINFPDIEPGQMHESCSLDVAERGGRNLTNTAKLLNLSRERIRQIEEGLSERDDIAEALDVQARRKA